jgi:hypothetical protein
MSSLKKSGPSSEYRGVSLHRNKYRAMVYIQSKQKFIGRFETAKEAALAYDRAVVHHKLQNKKINFPGGLPLDDEDYDALMNPTKKRMTARKNSTGYTGVAISGKRFRAQLSINRKVTYLGTYETAINAARAIDRAVILHKLPPEKLNFPGGLPIDDELFTNPKKKRKLQARNTTGYNGVCKSGKTFKAMIRIARKMHYLGTHATAKDAALAYDRAVIQHKLSSSKLNYPAPKMGVLKKYTTKKIHANNTTGYTGVIKNGKKFQALIRIDGKRKYLGTYAVLKEAALAYDRAVIQHKLPSSKLNFPNDYINSGEDDESSSDDDSDHDSDDEPTHARSPFPPAQSAQSQFQGDPMLDQLVAAVEAQSKQ